MTDQLFAVTPRDGLAVMFLNNFIKDGFPTTDPERQVMAAYMYADAIMKFKEMEEHQQEGTICKKCGNKDLHSSPAGTLEHPHQYVLHCPKCAWQETHEK